MRIYLAGANGKNKIIQQVHIDEAVSCISAYPSEIRGGRALADNLFGVNRDENIFGGGEGRHRLIYADFFSGQHDLSSVHRSDAERGGFSVDENISCGSDTVLREEKYRGGFDRAIKEWHPYILESFYYADADTERLIPYYGDFMLDSGAFTFCGTGGYNPDKFEEYLETYAKFIVKNNVNKFFELDVDSIVGYEKVKEYRKRLEKITNRQSIPVFHIERGKDEFVRHCQEYPYVALGGYVAAIKASDPRQKLYTQSYPWFIKTAHTYNAKIHGLGYTSLDGIRNNHFDSVDSTAWTTGNRFGYLYYFDGKTMQKRDAPKGRRLADPKKAAINNYIEWIKFQQYADKNL